MATRNVETTPPLCAPLPGEAFDHGERLWGEWFGVLREVQGRQRLSASMILPYHTPMRFLGVSFLTCWAVAAMALLPACRQSRTASTPDLGNMVLVPAGEFTFGNDEGAEDERPERTEYLPDFYIDLTEVTNAEFKAFCDATGRLYPNSPDWDPDYFLGKPDHPVINITHAQARRYCAWRGKRLPTEAEWEKAARGARRQLYPWGTQFQVGLANLWKGDDFRRTAPVGSFPAGATPHGVLDMVGNVWEWCEPIVAAGAKPPRLFPIRGGGFSSPPSDAVASNRSATNPRQPIHHLGCRCVWSPEDRINKP